MQDARQCACEFKLIQERLETPTTDLKCKTTEAKGHKLKSLKVRVKELWVNEGPRTHLFGYGESVVMVSGHVLSGRGGNSTVLRFG